MGSVMMRVVSAGRGGGAGAGGGVAGRQAAGKGGKRPAGSMAAREKGAAPRGWGCSATAGPRARGPAAARCCCRPGNPAGFINGRADVTPRAPPLGGPALPLKRPPHGEGWVGVAGSMRAYRHPVGWR